jgi:hypothetical protein
MYVFESKCIELDVQLPDKSVATFKNFAYSTDDPVKGEALTNKCGKNFWRVDNLTVGVPGETPALPKRRGRPPKIVQGTRMVEQGE